MDLKALKAQLDAAATALAASTEDAALVAAHAAAKSAYDAALAAAASEGGAGDEGDEENSGKLDISKLDPKAQKLIKDLRKENADSRKAKQTLTESHGKLKAALVEAGLIEDDEEAPEEKLKTVSAQNEMAVFQNAILEAAVEHGVGKADLKYFRFLVQERVSELQDGEELDEAAMVDLAKQARRAAPGSNSTSVENSGGAGPGPGAQTDVTLEQFVKMNLGEKTAVYTKNQGLYTKLMAEATAKRILV